jgi:hypothetical protein
MPPKRSGATANTTADQLNDAEKTLLEIAVHLVSAVRYREENMGEVEDSWLQQGFEDELVRVPPPYNVQITYWDCRIR